MNNKPANGEANETDGIASYRAILCWLVLAFVLAGGIAYLLIRPFIVRIARPHPAKQARSLPAIPVPWSHDGQACVARSISITGIPSTNG